MMILTWLSSVLIMVGSLSVFRFGISQCFGSLQKRFLQMSESTSLFNMLITTKLCAVGQGSFVQAQYSAVALLNSRSFSKRYAILLLCLSSAGLWTTLGGILLAWQLSGEIFLAAALPLFIYYHWKRKGSGLLSAVLGLGGFLVGTQWVLQKQSILLSVLGESEFHFLLADGRFPAQLLWLFVSFVLTLVIQVESWATLIALVLLMAGSLSLNGAVAIIIGELLAHVWVLYWRSRMVKSYAIASTVGLVIAFFAVGLVRNAFVWSEKSWQFLNLYLLVIIVQTLTVLVWGHFAAQKKLEEVQKGEYFPVHWISRGLVSLVVFDFIYKKLDERLQLLLAQKKDLDSESYSDSNGKDRAQIPVALLKVHEHEIIQLALWLPLAKAERSESLSSHIQPRA